MSSLPFGAAASVAFATNKQFAKAGAYLEAGRIVNNKLAQLIGPKLPAMIRGYASEPLGKLVLSNLLLIGLQRYQPGNQALMKLAAAGVTVAYQQVFENFGIEDLIDGFAKDSSIIKAMGLAGEGFDQQ